MLLNIYQKNAKLLFHCFSWKQNWWLQLFLCSYPKHETSGHIFKCNDKWWIVAFSYFSHFKRHFTCLNQTHFFILIQFIALLKRRGMDYSLNDITEQCKSDGHGSVFFSIKISKSMHCNISFIYCISLQNIVITFRNVRQGGYSNFWLIKMITNQKIAAQQVMRW